MHLHKHSDRVLNMFLDAQFKGFQNVCDHEFGRLHQKWVDTDIHHIKALTEGYEH